MAQIAQSTTSPWEGATMKKQVDRSFFWRRLHSVSGVLPVGAFMLFHIFENAAAISGAEAYDSGIAHLASLLPVPYFYLVEVALILVPIAYHGVYGLVLSFEAKPNVGLYAYRRNYLYLLQRVSGVVALIYLTYHVLSLRYQLTLLGRGMGVEGHPGYVSFGDMVQQVSSPWVLAWYVVGTLACAFHFGNGLNGFAFSWGLAVGERSRKVVEWIGWAVFVATAIPMLHILWTFRQAV